jgi:hypothetical protein
MKRIALASLLLLLATALFAADKPVTIKGEVVDTLCYASMGAGGEGHAKCGIACLKAGMPAGLVDSSKKMYILLPPKDETPLPAGILTKAGKVVSVTGHVYTSGGITFLTVESFQ